MQRGSKWYQAQVHLVAPHLIRGGSHRDFRGKRWRERLEMASNSLTILPLGSSKLSLTLESRQTPCLLSPIELARSDAAPVSEFRPYETAAAAAKSLQACPTPCDPVDGSPPGSPVPGILQARTLEWVAISFSSVWKWKVKSESEVAQSWPTLSDPMDRSPPGSSILGMF